jgi:hypothetical protein
MNKLKKILALATFSIASIATGAQADSSNFSGPFVGVQYSMAGIELDGKYTDPTQLNPDSTGQIGVIGGFSSAHAGWSLAVGDMMHVSLGGSFAPSGDAEFAGKELTNNKKVTLEMSDLIEVYGEIGLNITERSALFIHYGATDGELEAKGDDVETQKIDMSGETMSAGLKVVTESGIYVKAEAGFTEYDVIKIKNITDTASGTTASAQADPTIAFGALTIGYQF